MFTGLVQALGKLRERQAHAGGQRVQLQSPWTDLKLGESINVDGACLTVAEIDGQRFWVDLSSETVAQTTLGDLPLAGEVNLERALLPTDRLGGHLVSGHVDQVAHVAAVKPVPPGVLLRVDLGPPLSQLVAKKGSVCINGVSLTVNSVDDAGFEVMLIPHTLMETNLKSLRVGDRVNFEADLMARYAVRWLEATQGLGSRWRT
ncbi:MAG TPA: riboflavin synthase [Polyangiaceae bacterium]|nr:riboflavin synthase [Polyangiaceae bacterium]